MTSNTLQPVPLKSILNGDPVASIGGIEFGFRKNRDKPQQSGYILTGSPDRDTFTAASRFQVDTKRLEQLVQLPAIQSSVAATSEAAQSTNTSDFRALRQPNGFKFKCRPIGVVDKSQRDHQGTLGVDSPGGVSGTLEAHGGSQRAAKRKAGRLEGNHEGVRPSQKRSRTADG